MPIPLIVNSSANQIQELQTNSNLQLFDTNKLVLGTDGEFEISHNSSGVSSINATGDIQIERGGSIKLKTLSTGVDITGALRVTGDITAFYSSDINLKTDVTPISNALDKVSSISGNTFKWNEKTDHEGEDTGIIAQEIEKLNLPGLTQTRDNGIKAVRYDKLVPLLIEAIKELNNKVKSLGG